MSITLQVEDTIRKFCFEFIEHPYLCYTEHGLHARYYNLLYQQLPANLRYITFDNHKVCTIQKEYPTAHNLDKPKRQHWDISIIDSPPKSKLDQGYDYLYLNSVIEFGLNEGFKHVEEDVRRLSHAESNVRNKFIVHLYRISAHGKSAISQRDISPRSASILTQQTLFDLVKDSDVKIYLGIYDSTGTHSSGVWRITSTGIAELK